MATAGLRKAGEAAPDPVDEFVRDFDTLSTRNAQHHEEAYREASKSGYGTGWSRASSRAR